MTLALRVPIGFRTVTSAGHVPMLVLRQATAGGPTMRESMNYPCWCWRTPTSDDDACGSCGWPKAHHHDNGYRSAPDHGRKLDSHD